MHPTVLEGTCQHVEIANHRRQRRPHVVCHPRQPRRFGGTGLGCVCELDHDDLPSGVAAPFNRSNVRLARAIWRIFIPSQWLPASTASTCRARGCRQASFRMMSSSSGAAHGHRLVHHDDRPRGHRGPLEHHASSGAGRLRTDADHIPLCGRRSGPRIPPATVCKVVMATQVLARRPRRKPHRLRLAPWGTPRCWDWSGDSSCRS